MAHDEFYTRADVNGFLTFLNGSGGPELADLPLEEARGAYGVMGAIAEADALPLPVIRNISCPGPAGDIALRFYDARESREAGPAILFMHGGGFVIGDLDSHHALCTEIATKMDMPVLAVHYRRAPEHPFPAAPDDCEAAARWLATSPEELGREITGLIPIGDSAGGNLTIVVTQALAAAPAAVPVIMQVPIYPATDEVPDHPSMVNFGEGRLLTRKAMDWFMGSYAPESGNARAYPILGNHADAPPTVLVTAGLDPIRDQGRAYGTALIAAGIDVTFMEMKGSIHGFTNLRKAIPSAQTDTLAIFDAMKLMLGRITQ